VRSGRAEAFSDGVFAIAITLLVLSLRLPLAGPAPSAGSLTSELLHAWPQYFAYVVSFVTIGIMWMNHHTILGHVVMVDRALLVINLFLLMGVVAIPFPTSLVATNLGHPGAAVATVTYGLVMIAISLAFGGLWVYVVLHADSVGAATNRETLWRSVPGFTFGIAVYGVGTLVAGLLSPIAGLIIFGLLAVYYLFDHLPQPPREGSSGDSEGTSGDSAP
jgi:uncharacterized membrane protein